MCTLKIHTKHLHFQLDFDTIYKKKKTVLCSFYNGQLQCRPYEKLLILILLTVQEPGVETEATAPSTTAGPVLVDVPEPLVPAPPEFLCAWRGMRVELRDGLTESSVKRTRKFYISHSLSVEVHYMADCQTNIGNRNPKKWANYRSHPTKTKTLTQGVK